LEADVERLRIDNDLLRFERFFFVNNSNNNNNNNNNNKAILLMPRKTLMSLILKNGICQVLAFMATDELSSLCASLS